MFIWYGPNSWHRCVKLKAAVRCFCGNFLLPYQICLLVGQEEFLNSLKYLYRYSVLADVSTCAQSEKSGIGVSLMSSMRMCVCVCVCVCVWEFKPTSI